MATWITHLRIAEYFMKKTSWLNNLRFLVGNIAPDCGVPNKDHSTFIPAKSITHWKLQGDNGEIDAESFKQYYLQCNNENYSFYLGYYFHLIIDIEWEKFFHAKKQEPLYAEGFSNDEKFIWKVKKDWYGLDCIYLKEHKEFVYYTDLIVITDFPNIYLDFYPKDAFVRQIRYIKKFYQILLNQKHYEFRFLSKEENDKFVQHVISKLENMDFY